MPRNLILGAAALAAATAIAAAPVSFRVTGILYKPDDRLTRVSGILASLPHTSCRIDSITCLLPSGKTVGADDIDGIDFRRYFQWEEDGEIYLEIDFPAMVGEKGSKLVFHTVRGDIDSEIITDNANPHIDLP